MHCLIIRWRFWKIKLSAGLSIFNTLRDLTELFILSIENLFSTSEPLLSILQARTFNSNDKLTSLMLLNVTGIRYKVSNQSTRIRFMSYRNKKRVMQLILFSSSPLHLLNCTANFVRMSASPNADRSAPNPEPGQQGPI